MSIYYVPGPMVGRSTNIDETEFPSTRSSQSRGKEGSVMWYNLQRATVLTYTGCHGRKWRGCQLAGGTVMKEEQDEKWAESSRRRRASLVGLWLRIHLPMQGTRVRALAWEDPICCGGTKPVRHNYWACALEPMSHNYWAHVPRARALQQEKPP